MDKLEQIYVRVRQNESHGDLDNTLDVLWIAMVRLRVSSSDERVRLSLH